MTIKILRRGVPQQFRPVLRYYYVRASELGASLVDRLRNISPNGMPLPPASLRFRVDGTPKATTFLQAGKQCADDIRRVLRSSLSREINTFSDILDFGCGCGRVLRWLSPEGAARFYGVDIDGEAIKWCEKHLPSGRFVQNSIVPPLPFPSGTFDFVYGVSVFTHLDEQRQTEWLIELQRVTRPGSVLLLTVHGDIATFGLSEAETAIAKEQGFFFKVFRTGKYKLDGLPDFYQSSFHTRDYVYRVWSEFFEVVDYQPREMNGHQDVVVLIRR